MAEAQPRRRGRAWRVLLTVLAVVILIPLAGLALVAATFDPDSAKPRIEQAVKRATGRDLALNGRLGLKLSLWPTLEARDVALANAADGSRPQMVTLARIEAQIALLPLLSHRLEIERLVLVRPDILLETDADGRPNWRFAPGVPGEKIPETSASASSRSPSPATPLGLVVQGVRVEDGTLTYRDDRTGHSTTIELDRLDAAALSADVPVTLSAQASYRGTPFEFAGEVGPIARLFDSTAAAAPWPVRVALTAAGARLAVDGALSEPLQGRGYRVRLDATVPDLAALAPLLPRAHLPPLRDVTASAEVADTGGVLPQITGLAAHGTLGEMPVALAGSMGGAPGPYPVDVTGEIAGASLAAKGGLADPHGLGGVDLAVAAHIPDLAALSPLVGRPLPALHDLDFRARLSDEGGLRRSAVLREARLTVPQGDLAGDATLGFADRPSLRATVAAQRIDADALLGALAGPTPAPETASPETQPAPPAPAPPVPPKGARRLFPDSKLPFAILRGLDADLSLTLKTLRSGGAEYRDIAGHLVLANGSLTVDPFTAQLPAGRLDGRLTVDAAQAASPPVALVLRGPGLQLAPLLALLGQSSGLRGAMDVDADLHGTGDTPHALAASADGHLGLALVNGEIENRLVSATLGQVLRHAGLPDVTARPGATPVRCYALRLDIQHGIADVRALLLDTSLFYLEGGGSMNLGDETLALRLRPLARLGGTGVIVPLKVQGPMPSPKVEVDASGAAGAAAGIAADTARAPQLGIIIGALGGDRMLRGAGPDDCARDLALARGGLAGPLPAAAPAPAGSDKPKPPKPADLLRQFLR